MLALRLVQDSSPGALHQSAYALLEELLRVACARAPEMRFARGPWGKPELAAPGSPHISVSHCRGAVAAICAPVPVGVDVQEWRPLRPAVLRRVCSEQEQAAVRRSADPARAFLRLWALKESYVKAIGTGLSYPMRDICFQIQENLQLTSNRNGCCFRLYEWDGGCAAACALSTAPGSAFQRGPAPNTVPI